MILEHYEWSSVYRKVAWEELSLECSGSKESSPPGYFRPQTPEIENFRGHRQSRLDCVKTFVNTNADNNNLFNYGDRLVVVLQYIFIFPRD